MPKTSELETASILLVDDEPKNLLALEAILASDDRNLVKASSGEEALMFVLQQEFALILMDVHMQGLDGFETASLIQRRAKSCNTPIIFLTADYRTDSQAAMGYSAGAVDYMFKPVNPDILASKVAVFVQLFKKTREVELQAQQLAEVGELLQQKNEDLEERNRQIGQANQYKTQFLANMSHELRTPLTAILGFSELLLDTSEDRYNQAKRMEFLQHVHGSGKHLLALINDILDLAKVEAGQMKLTLESVKVDELVADVIATLQPLAANKGIQLSGTTDSKGELVVDAGKLKQILYNFLSNAIKFTPNAGRVTLTAISSNEELVLTVADSGIGISPEDQERIFHEFQQLDGGDTRRNQGTGLGLALTKRLVELQGGRIWVESGKNKGSRFHAALPLNMATLLPRTGRRHPRIPGSNGKRTEGTSLPLALVVPANLPAA